MEFVFVVVVPPAHCVTDSRIWRVSTLKQRTAFKLSSQCYIFLHLPPDGHVLILKYPHKPKFPFG
jgi:hypothetical protein